MKRRPNPSDSQPSLSVRRTDPQTISITSDQLIAFKEAQLEYIHPRRRPGRPGPDRRRWVIRPDDLLVLAFEPVNLRVQLSQGNKPAHLVKHGSGAAYLVVIFPPQHIIEKAFFTTVEDYPVTTPDGMPSDPDETSGIEQPDEPPIASIISGWSRVVFRVPDDRLPIRWTLEGLLAAIEDLELSVPANALPPRKPPMRIRDMAIGALNDAVLLPTEISFKDLSVRAIEGVVPESAEVKEDGGAAALGERNPIAVARARSKLRTIVNSLGLSVMTGSATREIHVVLAEDILERPLRKFQLRPEPSPPTAFETALELPYRVILSPNRHGAWFHASAPVTSEETGHTELWHTRLGTHRTDGSLVDGDDPLRKLRAVWTTDPPPPGLRQDGSADVPSHVNFPWRMSLDTFDRHSVVHLSSNFRLRDPNNPRDFYEPLPLDVDLLALSSLGAWLDSRGAWDHPQPQGLSVEEWRHRATLGRDHYVRVVYAGFLFPWGHRASVIKVTERQFHTDRPDGAAYLRQRMFLVVREPLKTYRTSGLKYQGTDSARVGESLDLMMPFEAVRITTRVSPLLNPPEHDDIPGKGQGCFWPNVGGRPFKFSLVATDTVGNRIDLAMPLIFVGKEETDRPHGESIIPETVVDAYATATWPDGTLRATVPTGGQEMAFAQSAGPEDTSFAARTLTFGAEVPHAGKYDSLDWRRPRYFPVMRGAQIDVPSLQRIAKTSQPASVVFAGKYLTEEFGGGNPGEVFLAADPAKAQLGVAFSSQGDRSGGLVTPDLSLSGLSRITGPISGNLDTAAAGTFDPAAWFGALGGAKLFGIISLSSILDLVGFDAEDALPQFAAQSLNAVEKVVSGLERLQRLVAVGPVSETSAVAGTLDQLLNPSTGSIPALLKGGDVATVTGQLSTLQTQLSSLQAALQGSSLPPGPKALVAQAVTSLQDSIGTVIAAAGLLQQFADGDLLPDALEARFEWRPVLKPMGPFQPSGTRNLLLAVEASAALEGAGQESFTVMCSLDDFVLDLHFVLLDFERVQLRMPSGKKPEVDVRFNEFLFGGPLEFVQTLRELIPFDGFSDPPDVEVSPEGISAGFTMGLPNLSVGVFSLENLSLGAGFAVPFIGPPMSVWFRFCERENPSRLTVSMFGGGFFIGITMNADGLVVLEGAIEFGAAISVDFGVASGGVSAMAGLYFKIEASDATLAGYFRLRGQVRALGLVSVCIELYLELLYETGSGKCVGTATLSIEIDVALFSTTISITATKKFAGSGPDPTFAELMDVAPDATSADWEAYCEAFA